MVYQSEVQNLLIWTISSNKLSLDLFYGFTKKQQPNDLELTKYYQSAKVLLNFQISVTILYVNGVFNLDFVTSIETKKLEMYRIFELLKGIST